MNLNNQKICEFEDTLLDKSVQMARELAKELIEVSKIKKQKYPFKEEYLGKLIKRWKTNPGKHIIHLLDLPDYFTIKFSDKGKQGLRKIYDYLKIFGLDRLGRKYRINLYLIHELLVTKRSNYLTIKLIKNLADLISKFNLNLFEINKFEKEIIGVRPGRRAKFLKLKNGFPIKLNDEKWAVLFGIMYDTYIKKFNFATIDKEFVQEINESLNQIGICASVLNERNIYKTGEQSIIGKLITLSGINTGKIQLCADNPLPHWIFTDTSKKFQTIVLSKIIETEGCAPNKNGMVRIAQSIKFNPPISEFPKILSKSKRYIIKPGKTVSYLTQFSKLSEKSQREFLLNPPLVLISTQILLREYKINSQLYPVGVSIDSNDTAAAKWHLNIQDYNNIKKLYDLCGEFIVIKKDKFKSYLNQKKRNCLPMRLKISYYLTSALKIQENQGHFTVKDLIDLTKRNRKTIYNTIGYLAQNNLIKTISKEGHTKFWNITKEGMKHTYKNKEEWDYLFK